MESFLRIDNKQPPSSDGFTEMQRVSIEDPDQHYPL